MKREDLYGDTDKLLFDILQELKKLNSGKENKEVKKSSPKAQTVKNKPKKKSAPTKKKEGA